MKKKTIIMHSLLVLLELIALVHDIRVFDAGLFQYYTINSNILQMLVSGCMVYFLLQKKRIPSLLASLHLVCAVCLTVTFMIAALVLAPQEGFDYYFLSDEAPINHFLGPVLSVLTFIFTETETVLPKSAVFAPMGATLLYGVIALLLNAARLLDGPYFFLRVYDEPVSTVILWFAIIAVLCLALSAFYLWCRKKRASGTERMYSGNAG